MTRRHVVLFAIALAALHPAASQTLKEMECRNQPIADILLALGTLFGQSLLPDETVTGEASYYFSNVDLDEALSMFLPSHHLYHWKEGSLYRVSRVRVLFDATTGLVDLDADSVDASIMIDRLARTIGETILFDPLAGSRVTLHARGIPPVEVLRMITVRYPNYLVERTGAAFYLRRRSALDSSPEQAAARARASASVSRSGELYRVKFDRTTFRDAVSALFGKAGKQYALLDAGKADLGSVDFRDRSFEEMLQLLADLADMSYELVDDTYYIHPVRKEDVLRRLDSTVVIPLRYLSAEKLTALLPASLAPGNHLRIDTASNSVVLNGTRAQIEPLEKFLSKLDRPPQNREYCRFDLAYLAADELLRLLPSELASTKAAVVPGGRAIILPLSAEQKQRVASYIDAVDRPAESVSVKLKYVRVSDLLANLPPGIDKGDIRPTADPSLFFLVGGRMKQRFLRRKLAVIDRPARQIRYELLVVQYNEGSKQDTEARLSNELLSGGERNAFLATIGRLVSLDFDIVSAFGYQFALSLNLALASSRARILADTTLNGISGEKISFRNTDTYRYRDAVVNPETGILDPTGVVREITSGLIIGIQGWVSGDDIITMDITSTVSARGSDTSGTANALPTTSEKVITTHVRTRSGSPVVIGGLMEHTDDDRSDGAPVLGKIPLIGRLFRKQSRSAQRSELAVYILPCVERPRGSQASVEEELARLYEKLVRGRAGE